MGLLSNRLNRDNLQPGDHIYSWRAAYIYAHHGIYVGDDKVIHFTRHGREVGTGTAFDYLFVSSVPSRSDVPCATCVPPEQGDGVVSSCLNCFLAGGTLYRFEYNVSLGLFLAKVRGGTCTVAVSDPPDTVVHRANYLLDNGFGIYNVLKNNCEHFAIYCKTGLVVVQRPTMGQSGQAASFIDGPVAAVLFTALSFLTADVYGVVAAAVSHYCSARAGADVGVRKDVVKVAVEDLTKLRDLGGMLQDLEPTVPVPAPTRQPSASS